ncbi:MAG: SDR family oxidoreductase [Bacteroidales bacterium]|nr:SDR family oxidoreductase [Bacteroidales bacterium]
MKDLKNKTAWITGASSGIGEALCYELASEGCNLVLSSNEPEELERVKSLLSARGTKSVVLPFDLTDIDSIPGIAQKAISSFGSIDLVFNNGGISQRSMILETPIANDRKIMEINYFSSIAITKAILPHFLKNGGGHIAVTSSLSGLFGFPLRSAYCASKHALHGFYETLRIEYLKENVKVTIACPDRVRTKISVNALAANGKPHGQMDARQDKGITPEDCARAIIKAVKKNKIVVLIGGAERISVYIKRYFPSLFYKLISKVKPT